MNKNSTIDTVFKNQLHDMQFDNAEAMWQRMEATLREQKETQDRKRYLLWLLLLIPVAAGLIFTAGKTGHSTTAIATTNTPEQARKTTAGRMPVEAVDAGSNTVANVKTPESKKHSNSTEKLIGDNKGVVRTTHRSTPFITVAGKIADGKTAIAINAGSIATGETVASSPAIDLLQQDKITVYKITVPSGELQLQLYPFKRVALTENDNKASVRTIPDNISRKKVQVSITAGTDLFVNAKPGGKYAMLLLKAPLNKKSSLSFGAGISSHSTSQSYIVAEKQATVNREVDAKLRGLTMLQFPILYEQALPGKKFTAKAGVTPVYILNAAVTNVPNSFTGVLIPYRSFTLADIHRFNVLFTTGLQYNITPTFGVEVRGNYGLTELVKNSYLNQSNENNNFKAIQLGLLWNFSRK